MNTNNEWVDAKIRAFLQNDADDKLPDSIDIQIQQTLASLTHNKQTRKSRTTNRIVAASIATLVAAGGTFYAPQVWAQIKELPAVQRFVQALPILGPILGTSDDQGMRKLAELGYVTELHATATDQDITLLIKEAVFDGFRFKISYETLTDKRVTIPHFALFINGNRLEGDTSLHELEKEAQALPGGMIEFIPRKPDTIPDKFTLGIRLDELYVQEWGEDSAPKRTVSGQWDFSVPVNKAMPNLQELTFAEPPSYSDDNERITVERVTKTESILSLEVHYVVNKQYREQKSEKPSKDKIIMWEFVDDKGIDLIPAGSTPAAFELISETEKTVHYKETMIFQPRETTSITMTRVQRNLSWDKEQSMRVIDSTENLFHLEVPLPAPR